MKLKRPMVKLGKTKIIDCDEVEDKLDPIGYFVIRVNKKWLEVGFCEYKKINLIRRLWRGYTPQMYKTVIRDMPKINKTHAAYLGKELTRAYICMKTGCLYIQDGNMKCEPLEAFWLMKK